MDTESEKKAEAEAFNAAASIIAGQESADAITEALNSGQDDVRQRLAAHGLNTADVFALASGRVKGDDVRVTDLARIALALGKTLKISLD